MADQLASSEILQVLQQLLLLVPVSAVVFLQLALLAAKYPATHLPTHHCP